MEVENDVDKVVSALHGMLRRRELVPGERVDQVRVAAACGVSKIPLREALRTLAAAKLVTYNKNRGYVVTRLTLSEMEQIYRLRDLVETEVLRNLEWPSVRVIRELRVCNEPFLEQGATRVWSGEALLRANEEFHFLMFGLSRDTVFVQEARRIWQIGEPYKALYLLDPEVRNVIGQQHESMIRALEARERQLLMSLMRNHRAMSRGPVTRLVGDSLAGPAVDPAGAA